MNFVIAIKRTKTDNKFAEQGTPDVHYEEKGPYHCEDCIHKLKPGQPFCIHPKVLKAPSMKDKIVTVDGSRAALISLQKGCCGYVNQSK